VLECVINVSEGHDGPALSAIAATAGALLLDLHRDEHHNRAVLTLAGDDVEGAARAVATEAVARLDLRNHAGVHPRIGVVDVVPFVPLGAALAEAVAARDRFAAWAGAELSLPCFLYGPERSLPDVRRGGFTTLLPDAGPATPHPTAGACAVGARTPLVAYNLWLVRSGLATAKSIAAAIRSPEVRALGLAVGDAVQVSCNLIAPLEVGPAEIYDRVAALAPVDRAELVGLAPLAVVRATPRQRWMELGLSDESTIEARLALRR
jgi:glutamate formiminotransferase